MKMVSQLIEISGKERFGTHLRYFPGLKNYRRRIPLVLIQTLAVGYQKVLFRSTSLKHSSIHPYLSGNMNYKAYLKCLRFSGGINNIGQ